MIVVFRRIKAAAGRVTGTEWLLVAVEGLLVFIGIFAAFQLQEWAEDRREARQVDRLLARMQEEVRGALALFNTRANDQARLIEEVTPAAVALSNGQCPNFEGVGGLTNLWIDLPAFNAFEEMRTRVGFSSLPSELHYPINRVTYEIGFLDGWLRRQSDSMEAIIPVTDPNVVLAVNEEEAARDVSLALPVGDVNLGYLDYGRSDLQGACADREIANRYISASELAREKMILLNMNIAVTANACHALAHHTGDPCFTPVAIEALGQERIDEIDGLVRGFYERNSIAPDQQWLEKAPR